MWKVGHIPFTVFFKYSPCILQLSSFHFDFPISFWRINIVSQTYVATTGCTDFRGFFDSFVTATERQSLEHEEFKITLTL